MRRKTFLLALLMSTPVFAEDTVTWANLLSAAKETICWSTGSSPSGEIYFSQNVGDRRTCSPEQTSLSPAQEIADRALEDAAGLIMAIEPTLPRLPMGSIEATAALKDIFAADPFFQRFFALALEDVLKDRKIRCLDCPVPNPEIRIVSWSEFLPYVAAYFWPDPPSPKTSENGRSTDEFEYSMHICVGINGMAEIPFADEQMRITAFLIAISSVEMQKAAYDHFQAVVKSDELLTVRQRYGSSLEGVRIQTQQLRQCLAERLKDDPALLSLSCEALSDDLSSALGLRISECPPN